MSEHGNFKIALFCKILLSSLLLYFLKALFTTIANVQQKLLGSVYPTARSKRIGMFEFSYRF